MVTRPSICTFSIWRTPLIRSAFLGVLIAFLGCTERQEPKAAAEPERISVMLAGANDVAAICSKHAGESVGGRESVLGALTANNPDLNTIFGAGTLASENTPLPFREGVPPDVDVRQLALDYLRVSTSSYWPSEIELVRGRWGSGSFLLSRILRVGSAHLRIERTSVESRHAESILRRLVRASVVEVDEKPGSNEGSREVIDIEPILDLSLRSADGAFAFVDARSSGYSTLQSLRTRCVETILGRALNEPAWTETPVGEIERAWVLKLAIAERKRSGTVPYAVIGLIDSIGDRRFEPFLRELIERPVESQSLGSFARTIDSYAKITRLDLRTRPFKEADVPEVRARYVRRFQRE